MAPGARPVATDSVSELIKKCQKAASSKQYNVALDIANTAVQAFERDRSVSLQTRVTLLDLRTALHIRIEAYDQASKDAKMMIRLDRADGRGYIRCGQIERRKGNRTMAVTFYEHGIKHVAASDQYSQLIAKELAAVKDELRVMTLLSKAKDPMTTLPLEVVEIILSNVPYKQHVQMLRVCKAWNRLLCSMSPLTDTLAFPDAKRPVTPKMLHTALKRLREPRRISSRHVTAASSEILARHLQFWHRLPELQHLEIDDKWIPISDLPLSRYGLRSIIFGAETAISFDLVPAILKDCPNLEIAQFKHVTGSRRGETYLDRKSLQLQSENLQVLNIDVHAPMVVEFEHTMLFSGLPSLKSLSCMGLSCFEGSVATKTVDLRHMKQLEKLELERCTMPLIMLPPSLRKLRFTEIIFEEDSLQSSRLALPRRPRPEYTQLENLESLVVYDCPVYPMFIQYPAKTTAPGRLEEFIISTSEDAVPIYRVLFHTGWSRGFKRVHVKGGCVEDIDHEMFLEHCPALEELCLDSAKITGVFITGLLRANPPKLRKITLKNCEQVSSDVVPWAKPRGVEVRLIRGGQELRGRRVRYWD
ncbi:hypothetical protein A1O1_06645 [Capronia coronata CBS 617.96]|uniref:F-box domain-containing protein n=1 Tax=Capronia coronata CBS 617.96 TaxID=1182541 RepID=W9Y9E2_9EURO|nr:uncharacterized protein A1O1_06645 [Capronia coronata CBS 617.96]EXJ86275.1 hypothetical protein A1O1_06645 [Capronia coronata CBS 617.96]